MVDVDTLSTTSLEQQEVVEALSAGQEAQSMEIVDAQSSVGVMNATVTERQLMQCVAIPELNATNQDQQACSAAGGLGYAEQQLVGLDVGGRTGAAGDDLCRWCCEDDLDGGCGGDDHLGLRGRPGRRGGRTLRDDSGCCDFCCCDVDCGAACGAANVLRVSVR